MNDPAASVRVSKIRTTLSVSNLLSVYLALVYNIPLLTSLLSHQRWQTTGNPQVKSKMLIFFKISERIINIFLKHVLILSPNKHPCLTQLQTLLRLMLSYIGAGGSPELIVPLATGI